MESGELLGLLRAIAAGEQAPEEVARLLAAPGAVPRVSAVVDLDRAARTGDPEIIFGQGKTVEQIAAVMSRLHAAGQWAIATRVEDPKAEALAVLHPGLQRWPMARVVALPAGALPAPRGRVAVVCAGTSDLPVAEEAAVIAELLGNSVLRVVDVGVAGLHRLLARVDELRAARVIIVVAGMEGALPGVLTGLVSCPVIGVPTSVGYGANFGGVSALLSMLNACAAGLSVVNIDNGFGAALIASRINRLAE